MWLCWFDDSTTDQRLLVTLAARCPRPSIWHSWIDAVPWSQLRSSVERLSVTPPRWLHGTMQSPQFRQTLVHSNWWSLPTRTCRFTMSHPLFNLLVTLATSRLRPSIWTSWVDLYMVLRRRSPHSIVRRSDVSHTATCRTRPELYYQPLTRWSLHND